MLLYKLDPISVLTSFFCKPISEAIKNIGGFLILITL